MNRPARLTLIGVPIVLAFAGWKACARAQDSREFEYKTLDCTMTDRGTTTMEKGHLATGKGGDRLSISLTAFDYEKQSATMVGNAGADQVLFIPSMKKAVLVQFSKTGNGFMTSVSEPIGGRSIIFHSRHSWMIGNPVVSEYQGTCTVRK